MLSQAESASREALAPGFAAAVFDAQAAFGAVMWAMARPGLTRAMPVHLAPPAPLAPEAAAVALALCDYETPIWLDPALAASSEVARYLRFHTGAPLTADPAAARFALIADPSAMPDFSIFAQGSPDYPDASTTLVVQVEKYRDDGLLLEGPGIRGRLGFGADSLPADIAARLRANRALFPHGVDLVLAGAGRVAALPRSVTVLEG